MCSTFTVSVVIPVYNVEKYLRRAIDSVLIEKEVGELILVEDGSTDDSFKVCLEAKVCDKRIRVLQHPGGRNKGVSASRNLGIKNTSCPFIAFLDADDYYLPNRFKTALKRLMVDSSIDGVYENIGVLKCDKIKSSFSDIHPVAPETLFENLNPIGGLVWFHANGLTVKRSIFEKSGFFDEGLRTSEDTLLWFKMAATATLVPGSIVTPVSISERRLDSLSSNIVLAKEDMNKMLLKLYKWALSRNISGEKIEKILDKFFFNIFNFPCDNRIERGLKEAKAVLRVCFVSPKYAFFKSKAFRRYLGNFFCYNKVVQFFKL